MKPTPSSVIKKQIISGLAMAACYTPIFVAFIVMATIETRRNEARNEATVQRDECAIDETKLESVDGVIRKASNSYYIYKDRWRYIHDDCSQKRTRQVCFQNRPGIADLEANIGKSAVVKFCNKNAVEYSISGTRYRVR